MKSASISEQPVILEKPGLLSHLFLWMIMLVSTTSVIWAYFANIEQTVPAMGQLALTSGAREIQAPTTGAVVRLHVENGDRVERNQPILTFSPTNPSADLRAVESLRAALEKENEFYESIVNNQITTNLPPELADLVRDREARIQENQTLQSLVDELYHGRGTAVSFSPNMAGLVANYRAEYQSRVAAGELRIQELEKQSIQNQDTLAAARQQLRYIENQLTYSEQQLNLAGNQLSKSEELLSVNESILAQISPLVEQGAMSDLQRKQQEQDILRNQNEVLRQQDQIQQRQGEINQRRRDIEQQRAEIERLQNEEQRIQTSIARTQQELQNTKDSWARDIYSRIQENHKQIASADSQLSRSRLENEKRISDIKSQIEKLQEQRNTQVLRAPASGIIFELEPSTKSNAALDMNQDEICSYVINSILRPGDPMPSRCDEAYFEAQQTQPLVTILDDDQGLKAEVHINNSDMALVLNALRMKRELLTPFDGKEVAGEVIECQVEKDCICPTSAAAREEIGIADEQCIGVEVNIDAFPSNEFGTVPGELIWISQNAIPPEEGRPFFSFRANIKLERQYFMLNEDIPGQEIQIKLQSGMAVNTKVNIGKRTVLRMLFSRLTGKFESITDLR